MMQKFMNLSDILKLLKYKRIYFKLQF